MLVSPYYGGVNLEPVSSYGFLLFKGLNYPVNNHVHLGWFCLDSRVTERTR